MNFRIVGMLISIFILVSMIMITIKTNFITADGSNDFEDYPSGLIEDLPAERIDSNLDYKSGLEKNNTAPDFELLTLAGETVKLSDFKGKKVILNFWASWCPPCRTEMPYMEKYYKQYKDTSNIEILAVNMTKVERSSKIVVKRFVDEHQLTFPILLDKDGDVMDRYKVRVYPTTYIINEEGIITDKVMYSLDDQLLKELVDHRN